jgi:hypothetical protein
VLSLTGIKKSVMLWLWQNWQDLTFLQTCRCFKFILEFKTFIMKKLFFLTAILVASFCSCVKNGDGDAGMRIDDNGKAKVAPTIVDSTNAVSVQ